MGVSGTDVAREAADIDLVIDVIPLLALSREPAESGIMQEPPRSIKKRLFNTKVLFRSLYIGLIITAGAMLGCFNTWSAGVGV
jgi:magnesium-transporting ATPase (P-type)